MTRNRHEFGNSNNEIKIKQCLDFRRCMYIQTSLDGYFNNFTIHIHKKIKIEISSASERNHEIHSTLFRSVLFGFRISPQMKIPFTKEMCFNQNKKFHLLKIQILNIFCH